MSSVPQYYSVEQVAELLGLHVRTVRGYIRDGRLRATRIGKQYRIARQDLEAFTGAPAAEPPAAEPRYAEVSAVVRIESIGRVEAGRVANTVLAAIAGPRDGGGPPLRVEAVHEEDRETLRLVVLGGPADTAAVLALVDTLIKENRHG
ncbi:helix-turn-helix domain-containing protein [Kitasatospora sp. A2-31]|uniref:helix-turn-helix domain-containing protein n=1 Tax=Kitasatospora sp. A2-31 TaxID=2916414 RepID=UPI001EEA8B22|nr:helix-turn-helix domain-containing protein [Kitasatospora sp. A2-31]MCG6498085.1 helix-turn-helix domain-containing protein [Kitasatospora sp. A2-31]